MGAPPTTDWLGAPDQGARTSPLRRLGRNGREIERTDRCCLMHFSHFSPPDEKLPLDA
jgi:hypothetical protein